MRRLLALGMFVVLATAAAADERVPTVIVDIHGRGALAVETFKKRPEVLWSAEFGNEMLLGVHPDTLSDWLSRQGVRAGPKALSFADVRVRDHVCTHVEQAPALAVVGGYEITDARAELAGHGHSASMRLPADGVISREVRNGATIRGAIAVDPDILAVTQTVDGDRWFTAVADLAGFNRNSFSPGLGNARDWVLARFTEAGLSTQTFPFTLSITSTQTCNPIPPPVTLQNPIGIKTGTLLPDEWIVIGAHYDARNVARCDGSNAPQPGANDNASGCAGVIELARVLQSVPTARTLVFSCFAGEEQGLTGSRRYVESLTNSGEIAKVKHMINLDMLGHAIDDSLSARVETSGAHPGLLAEYADVAAAYAPELNLIVSASTAAYSDHWYFLQAGVPSVFTWENGAGIYPSYHTENDVPANMQRAPALAEGILKMDAAMLLIKANGGRTFWDGFESP